MSQSEAQAWWTGVEDVRERIERRRASGDVSAPAVARERRTVRITGHGAAPPAPRRLVEIERRRPPMRPADRVAHRPDRIAMWAVFLGAVLVLVAMASGHS